MMMVNIYLDIDGVLKGCASPKKDIEDFLNFCLDNCSVYWLTTHCRSGVNYAPRALEDEFDPELIHRLETTVNPTDWYASKTEGIDFNNPFIWFDDTVFEYEQNELRKRGAEDNFFWVDKKDPESAKYMLGFVQNRLKELTIIKRKD